MLTLIINALINRIREHRDRQALRNLLAKDDRVLRDIGLTRPDIEAALGKPFGIGARGEAHRLSRLSLELDHAL